MFNLSKSQEIADLQTKVDALTAEKENAEAKATQAEATLATVTAERDVALAALQAEKDKTAAAEQLLNESQAKIATMESEMQTKIENEVITRLASAGHDPIERTRQTGTEAPEAKQTNLAGLTGIEKARAALQARADAIKEAQQN